ncbi:MAG: efflux RND transporter periplasmic adaptor subunit [Nitrospirota bacterium]|nr:efflux RND transporter periplasmic adaptor subunit [Nitrospirota bacterium]MDH5768088.1 efflux RND transporter periplasmic adaptor subunit [Nitrospirota bacterium]
MKKNSLTIVFCCLLFAVFCLLSLNGCKQKEVKTNPEKVVNVRVQPAEKRSLRPYVETIGTLNPNEEVIISAEVDGILRDVRVDEGTVVLKGMVLAMIDDIDYSLEVRKDEAVLKQAEATLANTKLEYKRKEALYKEELVTKQQFDDVSTRLALTDAEVERAKATLSLAREKLKKTRIYSRLSGVIKSKKVSAGDFVKNGTNLFVLIQNNPLKLNFTVTEKDVGKLKIGQDVVLKVDPLPDREFTGKVSIIYPSLEEKTRTLQVESLVPNSHGLLKPGLFAHVILYTSTDRETILIPITSLLYESEKIKVFLVEGDRAKESFVKTGNKYGEMMEIVEGVKEGDQVVVTGQQNLFENAKVQIQSPAASDKSAVGSRETEAKSK